jgi:hypothetical protein
MANAVLVRHSVREPGAEEDTHTMYRRLGICAAALSGVLLMAVARPAGAQEVNGIYTDATTKDLGEITGVDLLKGVKFRGWVEGYYVYNFNRVPRAVANAHQPPPFGLGVAPLSAIVDPNLTIEGRTFDVHHDNLMWNLAELEIEKVPALNGAGFKVDIAGGDTQDIIWQTVNAVSPNSLTESERHIQHASISYQARVPGSKDKGVRMDFGKFVTHIGGETIESIKNRNFSHAFFYSYGIPFQDTGFHASYPWSSKLSTDIWILNGWNVTLDNNDAKSYGASFTWTPSPKLAVTANYLGGPERNDNNTDWRHLGDFQIVYNLSKTLQTMVNIDVARDRNAVAPGVDADWNGIAWYLRKSVGKRFFPTLRAEYYSDPDGFTTGLNQDLWGLTFTADYKLGKIGNFANLMIRPEVRYDRSSNTFFSDETGFRTKKDQVTAGVGLVGYF